MRYVAQSQDHTGGFALFRWSDVNISAARGVQQLHATISIRHSKQKAEKDKLQYEVDIVNTKQHYHICPIALMLVHALRHKLGFGTTLDAIIKDAVKHNQGIIRWKRPELAVCPQLWNTTKLGCNLEIPAKVGQLSNTLRVMGGIAGLLLKPHPHALRYGMAGEVGYMFEDHDEAVELKARQLGHSTSSINHGITAEYIGPRDENMIRTEYTETGFVAPHGTPTQTQTLRQ